MNMRQLFRSKYEQLDYQELISSPVNSLIGVSPDASAALLKLGIITVFDLGSSRFFSNARSVSDYGSIKDLSIKFGMVPSDWVDAGTSVDAIDDLGSLVIDKLRDVGTALAKALSEAFNVTTIKELAYWPPYHAANQIVRDFSGSTMSAEDLQSEELRPRLGEYPTERVYYDTLVMLQLPMNGTPRKPLNGPLSLAGLSVSVKAGEGKDGAPAPIRPKPMPALGALLTYSQSWNAQGLTLGHLLHSLALAPGESTRIAMIDWSRKSSAGASESIDETEALDTSTNHSRAVSEVQTAVASEMQSGGSKSESSGKSSGIGTTAAGSVGASATLPAGGVPVTASANKSFGFAAQKGKTSGKADSSSWSIGTRSVGATMSQNVNDRTEQHAASVRNRRASAVREVSQNEHEQISTRIVANYNHMHALTVQYFEVVQIYRVTVKFHKAQRCLMIPMDVIDFSDPGIIERFREQLTGAALLPDLFQIAEQSIATLAITSSAELADSRLSSLWSPQEVERASIQIGENIVKKNNSNTIYVPENTELKSVSIEDIIIQKFTFHYNHPIHRDGSTSVSIEFDNGMSKDFGIVALKALNHITASFHPEVDITKNVKMRLNVLIDGNIVMLPAIVITPKQWRNGLFTCLTFGSRIPNLSPAEKEQKLTAHLKANADYYSAAIYRNMDDATMFTLLNQYDWQGKPLAAQVEPRAFTVAGNYLVFMAPVDMDEPSGMTLEAPTALQSAAVDAAPAAAVTGRAAAPGASLAIPADQQFADVAKRFKGPPTWEQLLTERNIIGPNAKSDERLVPIPTTGVFAEAVLGRSNSAEKLDITRFWNWQDSPIPLAAPEIAAIQAGSRAQAENLMPGQLGAPVVTVVNPTQLPDPAGLAAMLGAVQNGNMFRDMSGLVGTQAAMTAAIQAAGQAGQQAGENATTGMTGAQTQATAMHAAQIQKDVEQMKIAGDIAKASIGVPPVGKDKVEGISGDGARFNQAKRLDDETGSTPLQENFLNQSALGNSISSADFLEPTALTKRKNRIKYVKFQRVDGKFIYLGKTFYDGASDTSAKLHDNIGWHPIGKENFCRAIEIDDATSYLEYETGSPHVLERHLGEADIDRFSPQDANRYTTFGPRGIMTISWPISISNFDITYLDISVDNINSVVNVDFFNMVSSFDVRFVSSFNSILTGQLSYKILVPKYLIAGYAIVGLASSTIGYSIVSSDNTTSGSNSILDKFASDMPTAEDIRKYKGSAYLDDYCSSKDSNRSFNKRP